MKPAEVNIDALLRRLHLANARRLWPDLVVRAEKEQWSFSDFLAVLVAEEVAHRQQTRLGRLCRAARFPFLKTIDEFNFTHQSTLRLNLLGSALAPDFVTEGRSIVFSGKPGRGKTHLAIAIAYRAIQNGFDAFFTTAAELIDDLSAASRKGRFAEALTRYTHPHVLVVDEVGYLTYGTDAANVLFHVVNDRHRRKRAMLFTTNKPLESWGRVLHDEDLAQAILDRVLERGRHLKLDGPSIRTLHLGLDDRPQEQASDQPARISGIPPADFPEPTPALGHELVQVLEELGKAAIDIDDPRVVMVALHRREDDLDVGPPGGCRQAVHEGMGHFTIGAQEEASLEAAACDHVDETGDDGARQAHTIFIVPGPRSVARLSEESTWFGERKQKNQPGSGSGCR